MHFLSVFMLALCVDLSISCALPFWWSEQFHFPPYYPTGQPRSTYKYRETFQQTDPNNYVHVQQYSEYTWWEHDISKNLLPQNDFPQNDFGHGMNTVFFTKGGGFRGFYPHNRPDFNSGGVPHTNTNNIIPRDDASLVTPVDTNGVIPSNKTDRISPPTHVDTNGMVPVDTTVESVTDDDERERERNENEDVTRIDNMEGNDLESESETRASFKLPDNRKIGNFLSGWFGTKNSNESEPCKVSESDIHSLRSMIEKMFSLPREQDMHAESKEKAREDILNKFKDLGLQVWTQNFTTPPMKNENGTDETKEGVNLIGVIPGSQRGHLDDEIVLVGAHYDTVADSNGVDDNGSGLAVMLEVAKAITEARCRLNHTLMFVAFDHEEHGALGSNYFVDHYLIPEELKRARARFQGAFILDGILNYNDIPDTQELPKDYAQILPGLQYFVNHTGNRGNFLAMISRAEMDNHLSQKLMDAWQDLGDHHYKLFNLAVDMGNEIPTQPVIEKHLNFLRSDHATFWYHNSSSHFPESLNAVLLTDTGPFRGQMKECYHSKCDDLSVISPEKLQFAKKTADALTATLVELTRATALGNQIHPMLMLYALQASILYFTIKILFH